MNKKTWKAAFRVADLFSITPGETKIFVHSVGKEDLPPETGTLELDFVGWRTADDKMSFRRDVDYGRRPLGGWK